MPVPTAKQNVLTTSAGDVVAILKENSNLRAIYRKRYYIEKRVKMDIHSGAVENMTPEKCAEVHTGNNSTIKKNFSIVNINDISSDQ